MKSRARKPNNQNKSITAGNWVHFVRNKATESNDIAYAWARTGTCFAGPKAKFAAVIVVI